MSEGEQAAMGQSAFMRTGCSLRESNAGRKKKQVWRSLSIFIVASDPEVQYPFRMGLAWLNILLR
jgi:hypothetical protein